MVNINLDNYIRKVPDFPKPGILFYDITGVLMQPVAFNYCIDTMLQRYRTAGLDAIAAVDARGFIFAAPLARELELPLILVRKKGKLPGETYSRSFALEYGTDEVEIHKEDLAGGGRILIVDDLIATGGTLKAAAEIIEEAGSTVAGIFSVIGLPFLEYGPRLSGYDVVTLIDYSGE
ncbi:MAG: adenine phosphoribosyltransferase [Spirochaetia bacterium]